MLYRQWFHCTSILKHTTRKFTVLSIIFIDAHNFTHSGFPSLALNVLLKDYLIAQLQSFWNSLKKFVPRTKPKPTARKQKRQLKAAWKWVSMQEWFILEYKISILSSTHVTTEGMCQGSSLKEWWIHSRFTKTSNLQPQDTFMSSYA